MDTLFDKVEYIKVLEIICLAMILEIVSGIAATKLNKNKTFKASTEINEIVKKLCILLLLLFFIPVSSLLKSHIIDGFIYTLYTGYLWLEIELIIENYKKLNVNTAPLDKIISKIKKNNDDK